MVTPRQYTSQKQQERMSRRQFCERLDEFGWLPSRPDEDLGEDFIVHIYFEGRATGVTFHAQLKSVTNLNERRHGDYLVYDEIKVKDLKHWAEFELPVALIVWDVNLREGRWALVADLIGELDQRRPQWRENTSKVRVQLPWGNGTDDRGLVRLRHAIGKHLYPLFPGSRPIELDVNLNLSNITKDQLNIEEKRETYRHSSSPLDQLHTIQEKLGHLPPVPETGLTQADRDAVRELGQILDYGQRVTKLAQITADFRGLVLKIILDAHRRGNSIYIRKFFEESFVDLFGTKIATGRRTRQVTGRIDRAVDDLEQDIKSLQADQYLSLKLVDVEIVDIFPDQYIREAERLSRRLAENFEIEAVYLFGSLVWNRVHVPETDIDLAVVGLPPEQYFKAMGFLERASSFPTDLVEVDKVSDYLRQRILTEGKLLYEREPVAAIGK